MRENAEAYFSQSHIGESRWWSWGVGFWFTIIGWITAQTIIVSPMPAIAGAIDPTITEDLSRASATLFDNIDMVQMSLLTLITLGGAVMGAGAWAINRFTTGTVQKVFGILAGIGMFGSTIAAFKLIPMINSPELVSIQGRMIEVSALNYFLLLLTFPAALIGLYLCQKYIHRRTILSLHTAAAKFRWRRMGQAMLITGCVYAVFSFLGHMSGLSPLAFSFDADNIGRFLAFAIVSLLFIPLQSATEEIIVRGYMNQGLESILRNKWLAIFLTSFAFMALHLANPEATSAASQSPGIFVMTMSSYFLFGFFLSLMVCFDGGLEAAIGVHAANNLFAAIFVNYENSALPTPSVFLAKINAAIDLPMGTFLLLLVTYLIYWTRRPVLAEGARASATT